MSNVLHHKGYWAKVEFDAQDGILHGKIEGIDDLITFESDSTQNIQTEFEETVNDYLAFCSDIGKEPQKPCSGSFNVRIQPELHRECLRYADEHSISLNKLVSTAIEDKLHSQNRINVVITNNQQFPMERVSAKNMQAYQVASVDDLFAQSSTAPRVMTSFKN